MKLSPLTLRVLHFTVALLVTISVLYVAAFSTGPLPPLGKALNAGKGIWTDASAALPVKNQTLHLPGLQQTVTVIFERDGTAHIQAATDHDLFWTIGYLHARFRLTQMDLERRQGEGRLAEILGTQALASDQFELMLGLQRTAEAEWQSLPASSAIRQILLAYSDGVNARINEEEQSATLPFIFKLLNYQPQPWTPVDTLIVQGDLIQTQDFSTTPLQLAELVRAIGYQRVMQWFPVLPPDAQHPYDTGPYAKAAAPAPLPAQIAISQSTATMNSISYLQAFLQQLPVNALRDGSESNNWAVNGPKSASGKAIMAGDPHLRLTLPAIWYQIEGTAPGYDFSGVSVPGIPTILIGHTQHISWSMTDVQNQSTLFYVEKTDKAHPHQYFWDGSWHAMQHLSYEIPVLGAAPAHYDLYLTVHGPIMPSNKLLPGQTIALDWIGALPTDDGEALLEIIHATNFAQFKAALSNWKAPTLNFVYADDQGDIGMISPGYYPIVRSGAPWLPLPGTGEADIVGSIPYNAVPQVYDPPNHMVFSANQRPVSNSYPYYIGTTLNDFDNGYRADEIYSVLSSGSQLTMQDMEQLQTSTRDYLASLIVPQLMTTLQQASLNGSEQQALSLLEGWNDDMDANSAAASIWWTFWNRYLTDTFQPWWNAYHVPVSKDQSLAVSPDQTSLDEDLESWTLHDQRNSAFTPPKTRTRDAAQVMLQAFKQSVSMLGKALGSNPRQWTWGKLHTRAIVSLLGVDGLSYGPRGNGGDSWTTNAAGTDPLSANNPSQQIATAGPSWRMIVDWGSGQAVSVYPGGQSENPASPWYENEIAAWWSGQYYPMLDGNQARQQSGSVIWTLEN